MTAVLIGVDFTSSGPEETSHGEYVYRKEAEARIAQLEEALIYQYDVEISCGETMTDAEKIQYFIDRAQQ